MKTPNRFETQVLIIGGGVTGVGLARDLALRGVRCMLVERADINAGASGANHGLLHSGGRYVYSDPDAARECRVESELLKQVAPHCIESTGGFFVAVEGDDETYIRDFPDFCARCGIPVKALDPGEAIEMEPQLNPRVIAAYEVEDASIDPFRLSLDNVEEARRLGSVIFCQTEPVDFRTGNKRILSVRLRNTQTGEEFTVEPDQVVNAAGAWVAEVASLFGATIQAVYSKGSLLITNQRLAGRVLNRLRPPSDGDIIVPGGTVSLLGTTSIRMQSLADIRPTIDEVERMIDQAAHILPVLETTRYIRAYSGVRPLLGGHGSGDDRLASRGFALFDHARDGIDNCCTITGGKLTTYRLMAEKTADLVCMRLGLATPCTTKSQPLPASEAARWTTPAFAPTQWLKHQTPGDSVLCDCEIVPQSTIEKIVADIPKQGSMVNLKAIGLRSRIGKGACQGALCGARIALFLSEKGEFHSTEGLESLRNFLNQRWKGLRPVLWSLSLIQEELQEALHCGLFSLEL